MQGDFPLGLLFMPIARQVIWLTGHAKLFYGTGSIRG